MCRGAQSFIEDDSGVTYLQAASWTVLCDDAHVWWVNAAANEASQMFILNVSHLQKQRGCSLKSHCLWESVGGLLVGYQQWSIYKQTDAVLTCFSSNRTLRVSSIRFLLIYLMAARFPYGKKTQG